MAGLFVVATVTSVVAVLWFDPLLSADDMPAALAAAPNAVVGGTFIMFASAGAAVAIPVVLYPLLSCAAPAGALLYVVARVFESMAYVLGGVITFGMLWVARSGGEDGLVYALNALSEVAYDTGPTLFFGLGAMVLAVVLWQSRLVPRWLSGWKALGAALIVAQGALSLYGPLAAGVEQSLYMPIAINEMVLAIWLVVKGFDGEAVARIGF